MRLAKHKLAKAVVKATQSAKHKKSEAHVRIHREKEERKSAVQNSMDSDNVQAEVEKPVKEKDRSRTAYKRRITNISASHGPRAVQK